MHWQSSNGPTDEVIQLSVVSFPRYAENLVCSFYAQRNEESMMHCLLGTILQMEDVMCI